MDRASTSADRPTRSDGPGSAMADVRSARAPSEGVEKGRPDPLAPGLGLARREFAARLLQLGFAPDVLAWARPPTDSGAPALLVVSTWVHTLGAAIVRPPLERARALIAWPAETRTPELVLRPAYTDAALAIRRAFVEGAARGRSGAVADAWIAVDEGGYQIRFSWIIRCRRAHARGPDDRRRFGVFQDRVAREGGKT